MEIVLTIECRMGSSRLPGKVLMEAIDGYSMLEYMVRRVKLARTINTIVLATSTNPSDDKIEILGKKLGVKVWRGPEHDVLRRVLGAAEQSNAKIIVELCGDCPLVDPKIIDELVERFQREECDYCGNCNTGYPDGMDVQVFTIEALKRANLEGKSAEDREHVSWYIRQNPEIFRQVLVSPSKNLHAPEIRVTLDEPGDEKFLRQIMNHFRDNPSFSCDHLIKYVRSISG